MDPITLITAALTAGVAAASQDLVSQAIKDAYNGLKSLVVKRFGDQSAVAQAIRQAEEKPQSTGRQTVLREELEAVHADQDAEVISQAQALLDLLKRHGQAGITSYTATLTGSGAIAQGARATAAGEGGVAVGGNVYGGIRVVSNSQTGNQAYDLAESNVGAELTPEAVAGSLRAQLHKHNRLLEALKTQRILASASESAKLAVEIADEEQEIKRLERELDSMRKAGVNH